ncbi:aminoglycoside N(3)-acetyltransferase [Symbioplanes lichenis]|uniref:aminoglycoside N(3)-acetyltransferase n=1 Tax=Symbioplanes lichenis TaxID=1629072 RepID=UPI00273964F6|nr:AAC(3) family N-acetyltransferase [Actinoplanes lichenis]
MDPAQEVLSTAESLEREFIHLGVCPGDVILLHSSLRAVGWVCGGPTVLVQALLTAAGPAGTVVVPAQTLDNRHPSRWGHRPVPPEWWAEIIRSLPAFDPELTPSTAMGAVAERVRTWPGAARSAHPLTSFAAIGPRAAELMAVHELSSLLGDRSPLAALERSGAKVLLLGVGYESCTAFHLAETRLPGLPVVELTAAVRTERGREWVAYESIGLDAGDFDLLGKAFESDCGEGGVLSRGMVGAAPSRLFPLRDAVRFAEGWLPGRRPLHATPASGTEEK